MKKAETSKVAWDSLKSVFESKGPVRKATLYKQLYHMKKDSSTTMNQHVSDFTNKAEQLAEIGIRIPESLLSIMLLGSLPDEFENFSIAIESRDKIPNVDNLKVKLLEEEARQNDRDGRNDREKVNSNNDALNTKTTLKSAKNKYSDAKDKHYKSPS